MSFVKPLLDDNSPVKPQQLISELIQHFPPETRYLIDVGNWLAWSIHYFFPLDYEAIYRDSKPTVLDMRIDPEYVPPIGMF